MSAGGVQSVTSHTDLTVSGVYSSHTDMVTMATDSTGTDTVTADPTRNPPGSSKFLLLKQKKKKVQSLNSTTHLVRVLKVQKMWNWRIPADFHIKPRVRFLRYRFQCTDQSAWPRKYDPSR
ncbi:hypothetical protein INR49_007136 [Caranx melampygus]|nr:hypothetical protein INR49_007136 [Caranx melampygus]